MDLSVLHNRWVVVGLSAVLGVLYLVSFILNRAHFEDDLATINGLGFIGGNAPGNSGMVGNIFIIPALVILIGVAAVVPAFIMHLVVIIVDCVSRTTTATGSVTHDRKPV